VKGEFDTVLVVDFGAQYAQLIARRVREAHVFSEIVPRDLPIAELLARRPSGIILSGGPKSVHVEGAPTIDPAIYDAATDYNHLRIQNVDEVSQADAQIDTHATKDFQGQLIAL